MMIFLTLRDNRFQNVYSLFRLLILLIIPFSISSCKISAPFNYLSKVQRDTVLTIQPSSLRELVIQKGDKLSVVVSSLNKEEDLIFNSVATQAGFEVGKEGEIYLQRLGKIKVEGLTPRQLKDKLESDLKSFLKDPLVVVKFTNHKVTILGQVGKPQILPISGDRVSVLDAIAQGGNTLKDANLSNIIVVRDSTPNHKLIRHLNLEDPSIFQSPFYHLQPNDLVIVNPDKKLAIQDQERLRVQQTSSIIFQIATISIIIYQTFFR